MPDTGGAPHTDYGDLPASADLADHADHAGLTDEVSRLVHFLRDVARARRNPVRDIAAYEQVHWLADLPGEIRVRTDATRCEVLFSVPSTSIEPPSEPAEFDGWLSVRRWHRILRGLAEQQGAEYELVLATGLLDRDLGDLHVRNHVLVTPVRVVIDPATERADVVLLDRPAGLQDRALLEDLTGFRPERVDWVRDSVRTGQGYGLQTSVIDVLRNWCSAAFDERMELSEEWTAAVRPAGAPPTLRLAPALVLRVPERAAVLDFYDAVLGRLSGAAAGHRRPEVSRGMARLVDPDTGPDGQVAYLPERDPQVIADLVTSLLVQGRRVLIAAPGPHFRTLDALRAAVPAQIAPLCVGPAQAEESAAALAKRFSTYDPEAHEQTVADLMSRLSMMQGIVQDLRERIDAARSGERYEIAPGYHGTLPEITEQLAQAEPACSWMPLDDDLPPDPPLTPGEAAGLLRLLAEQTPQRIARTGQLLPEPEALPSVEQVRALIATERSGPPVAGLHIRLSEAEPAAVARLQECATTVTDALRALGLPLDPERWDESDWAVRAIRAGVTGVAGAAGREQEHWERLAAGGDPDPIDEAGRLVRMIGARRVVLPPGDESALLTAARRARERMEAAADPDGGGAGGAGGARRRGRRGTSVPRGAQRLLAAVSVDGDPPATAEALDAVIAALRGRQICRDLARDWAAVGVMAPDLPLDEATRWFAGARTRLDQVRAALPAIAAATEVLSRAGLPMPPADPAGWARPVAVLTALPERFTAEHAGAELDTLKAQLEIEIQRARSSPTTAGSDGEAPELHEAVAAITSRDPVTYGRCIVALAEAHRERAEQARCEELLERLRSVHPSLAALMTARSGDEVWKRRIELWNDAWRWAYASVFVARRPRSEMEQRLEDALAEAYNTQARHTTTLTVELAWGWCMSRMTTRPADAVLPVWVMPIWQVVESIPPEPDSFDVVVLDETAQEGVEALFLLWLGAQVIMVGGGEPRRSSRIDVDRLPGPLGDVITPEATVFSVLAARMGPVVEPRPDQPAVPVPPEEPATTAPPPPVDLPLRPGLSIASYQRSELMELVSRLAASGHPLTDDELIQHARTLLDGPADERVFATARLRYVLDLMRAEEGSMAHH